MSPPLIRRTTTTLKTPGESNVTPTATTCSSLGSHTTRRGSSSSKPEKSNNNANHNKNEDSPFWVVAVSSLAVGTVAGWLGSLAGMGGGFVMIPLMTARWLPLRLSQHQAHGTSLVAVAATGLAGAVAYGTDHVRWMPEALAVTSTAMVAAYYGARATVSVSGPSLNRALGCLMLLVAPAVPAKAYYLAQLDSQQQGAIANVISDNKLNPTSKDEDAMKAPVPGLVISPLDYRPYVAPALIGVGSGFLSGLFGVGGGTIVVPALTLCTDLTHHQALGTSLAAMILPALSGSYTHYQAGHCVLRVAPFLAVGALVGATLGARTSIQTNETTMRYGFSILLAALGIRTLLKP